MPEVSEGSFNYRFQPAVLHGWEPPLDHPHPRRFLRPAQDTPRGTPASGSSATRAFRDRVNRKVLGTLVPPNSITCRLQAYLGMLVPEGAKPETVKDQLFRRKAKDAGARSCGWARDAAPHAPFCSISGNAPPRPPSTEPQRRRLGKISLPSAPPSCLSS